MKILVTGAAGFIGMHVSERLLAQGDEVVGLDNLNDYYDISLKEARLARLIAHPRFKFIRVDVADRVAMPRLFESEKPERVVHLAAQAGVRYSLTNPHSYVDSNITGFMNILEGCRHYQVEHLVYASSSSVYGGNVKLPFGEDQPVDHPISLYAATKKANELMAHSYSHLFGLPTSGLRFFTVYGPWGRPDMALFLFAKAILAGEPINVFNEGRMQRDFTYIDDVVESIVRVLGLPAVVDNGFDRACPHPAKSWAPFRVINIGNHAPVELMTYVRILEKALSKSAILNFMPMQAGDVISTNADISELSALVNFWPETPVDVGIERFVEWFKAYYRC
jgi:UDP-glucuronate 4-epimerase